MTFVIRGRSIWKEQPPGRSQAISTPQSLSCQYHRSPYIHSASQDPPSPPPLPGEPCAHKCTDIRRYLKGRLITYPSKNKGDLSFCSEEPGDCDLEDMERGHDVCSKILAAGNGRHRWDWFWHQQQVHNPKILKHKAHKTKCQLEEKINWLRSSKAQKQDFVSC